MNIDRRKAGDAGQEEMPVELQLDLLVDGELTEAQRRTLLRRMEELGNHAAVGWRELALRFIERQTEKETIGKLMAGGRLVPVEFIEPAPPARSPWRMLGSPRTLAVAAGVMIAVVSAALTFYVVQNRPSKRPALEFNALLPGAALGGGEGVHLRLPLAPVNGPDTSALTPTASGESGPAVSQRSLVIQSDGNGQPVAVPVNVMMMQVH